MLRFVVPAGTFVPPNGALVVFGSGPLVGTFGGAIVLSADTTSSHLNFNNSGEVIVIKDANGNTVLTFDSDALSNNPNESYTRFPDLTGAFIQHGDTTAVLFSPGTKADGTPFNTNFVVETITVQGAGGATTISTNAGSLQMEAMVTPSFAADTTVVWSVPANNGVATINATGLLQAAGNGMVYVKATANDGSGVADSIEITITNQAFGIDENAIAGLSVYPNPAVDKITINADVKIDEVSVYSITSQLMLSIAPEGNRLDVSTLPKGLYLLKITSGDAQSVVRITKN